MPAPGHGDRGGQEAEAGATRTAGVYGDEAEVLASGRSAAGRGRHGDKVDDDAPTPAVLGEDAEVAEDDGDEEDYSLNFKIKV